jgi:hypothetical protein
MKLKLISYDNLGKVVLLREKINEGKNNGIYLKK